MSSRIRHAVGVAMGLLLLMAATAVPAGAAGERDTVQITGNVYNFAKSTDVHQMEGAVVRIAEYPELQAIAGLNGAYSIEVPNGADVTPYATVPGFYPVHNQTFHTRGMDLRQINFQMPSQGISEALAAIAGVEMHGEPGSKVISKCAIVSTFFEKEGRSFVDFPDFNDFRPHGVIGATAAARTANGEEPVAPIYFNSSVIPDRSQEASSRDGGVIWPNEADGVYTVDARHDTDRFSQFQASCAPGRLVNASPPWGVYEMYGTEEPNPAVFPVEVAADTKLDARVTSAKVVKKGKARTLKVKVKTSEKITAQVTARQAGRKSGRKGTFKKTRVMNIKIGGRWKGGSARVNVNLRDAAGNKSSFATAVSVPGKGRRAASVKDAKAANNTPTAKTVTISGNAYAFIFAGDMRRMEGAVIKVVEFPELETVAGEQGAWSLEVPDNAEVTPYATFPNTTPEDSTDDYFTTHAQTFFTRGKDITRINFQMPKQWVVETMAAIIGAEMEGVEGKKTIKNCAVVSTFFRLQRTKDGELIDGRTYTNFDDFHDYRAHGVADSTATMTDPDGNVPTDPIYFNSSVIPDPEQPVSSGDGGVVWPNIAAGKYTVRGQHETKRFGEAQINCEPGRLVNASPPWGLYQMAGTEESNPATFAAPAPLADRKVDSRLGSLRVNNRRIIASLSTDSGERVKVVVNGKQGKRKVKTTRNLASGRGLVKVKLPKRFTRGKVATSVVISDQAGNKTTTSAVLYNAR